MTGKSSHELGSETEARVLSELKSLGLSVSIPWGRPRYDMIVDSGDDLWRAQVKTARDEDGSISFECRSGHINSQGNKKISYTKDEIDVYIVYSPDTDEVYWIPIEQAPQSMMALRYEELPRYGDPHQVNWHDEYMIENKFGSE